MSGDSAVCRRCGRAIRFNRTQRGRLMPVDDTAFLVVPTDAGELFFREDGSVVRGSPVTVSGPRTISAWKSHFATCPEIKADRSRSKGEDWNAAQDRLKAEQAARAAAEAAAKAARREEAQRREAAEREFQDSQYSLFSS